MNKFDEDLIDKYADNLLIGLTREENKLVLEEFDQIDKHISKLNEIEGLSNVEPMTHCLDDFSFSLREDECEDSVDVSDLLRNCDRVNGREVEVVKVVG